MSQTFLVKVYLAVIVALGYIVFVIITLLIIYFFLKQGAQQFGEMCVSPSFVSIIIFLHPPYSLLFLIDKEKEKKNVDFLTVDFYDQVVLTHLVASFYTIVCMHIKYVYMLYTLYIYTYICISYTIHTYAYIHIHIYIIYCA